MNLAETLAKEAKKKGICKEWYDRLKSLTDKRDMAEMYLQGIDFCLRNDYPSNEFIRTHFSDIASDMGIFVNETLNVQNKPKCVCLGATKGNIKTTGYAVSEIFAKHDAELIISANGDSFVMVDVFDNACVHIYTFDRAKVIVNHYGGKVIKMQSDITSTIRIREKNKLSY